MVLKLPEGLVQLHALEVHFIYHTADAHTHKQTRRKRKRRRNTMTQRDQRSIQLSHSLQGVFGRICAIDPSSYLLQDVSVELFLPVSEELPDHLPAQPLPLQQEVSHPDRCVGDEPPLRQVLDALLGLPGESHMDRGARFLTTGEMKANFQRGD